MGVKTKVPEAAALIGEHRVDRRVVEKHHPLIRLALVVLADRIDQSGGHGRGVALHHDAYAVVYGRAQGSQRLFALAFAVVADHLQRSGAARQPKAPTRIDPLGRPDQVAKGRLAAGGQRPRQGFDEGDAHWRLRPNRGAQAKNPQQAAAFEEREHRGSAIHHRVVSSSRLQRGLTSKA